jgi:hypothetical protein
MTYNTNYWDMISLQSGESTIPRRAIASNGVQTVNNIIRLTYFVSRVGETVTQVRTLSGSQAAVGATLAKVGIYSEDASGNLTLVGATANTTSLWGTVNTSYTTPLSSSFAKLRGVRYAVGVLVVGTTTAPFLHGITLPVVASETAASPRMSGTYTASDLPSSIAAGSVVDGNLQHYAVLLP